MAKARRDSRKGQEIHAEKVLCELYGRWQYFLSLTNTVTGVGDYFPKHVAGPAKYCAQCLDESGFVPAIFALRFIVNCPWHQQPLKPMCQKCRNVRKFKPAAFGSAVGYRCQDCGYWVPRRAVIFSATRTAAAAPFFNTCSAFLANTDRLHRLSVLDVLHFNLLAEGGAPAPATEGKIQEFLPNESSRIWIKTFELGGFCPPQSSPDECYESFVRFHQLRLLKAHRTCACCAVLSLPNFDCLPHEICVYTASLSLFRQKFECSTNDQMPPRLSARAAQELARLQMSPPNLRRFFQSAFYKLVARLHFWRHAASKFYVHVDCQNFSSVLEIRRDQTLLNLLIGEGLRGVHTCQIDLPADRSAMRALIGLSRNGPALAIRNNGSHVEFKSAAKNILFYGILPATAMFYF